MTSLTFSSLPSLGNIDAYIKAANNLPMLTHEEEQRYARRFRDLEDIESAGRLVLSHLRLVVATARQYMGHGLPHADLIQEGNVGLMKAVKRFNPDQGVRLVSYAIHWIKAEIHEYVMKNYRMIKMASTKAQRKLFFNLRSMRQQLQGSASVLTMENADVIASKLGVERSDVLAMEERFNGNDVLLDPSPSDSSESDFGPISYLSDASVEPLALLEACEREHMSTTGVQSAPEVLDPRTRDIIEQRWLKVNDEGSGGATLQELGTEYGVSCERIRQIEVAGLKKMRQVLC